MLRVKKWFVLGVFLSLTSFLSQGAVPTGPEDYGNRFDRPPKDIQQQPRTSVQVKENSQEIARYEAEIRDIEQRIEKLKKTEEGMTPRTSSYNDMNKKILELDAKLKATKEDLAAFGAAEPAWKGQWKVSVDSGLAEMRTMLRTMSAE